MKTIMITAPSSNSGKTFVTLGIIRALKKRGLNVCGYKTGPDYIDTKFLEKAAGTRAGNLDIHLMGIDGLNDSIAMGEGEYGVVEGAMGYFDGIHNTFLNSSYDISKALNINTILVYTPKGEMFSAIPKIKGMVDFEGSMIKGIILNKVSFSMYILLKEKIEEYIGIKVLGYVENDESLKIDSRHLGLIQSDEIENIDEIIERVSILVEKKVDLDKIIELMSDVNVPKYIYPEKRDLKVAIAYDSAFSFYYNENLRLFENVCDVVYFSPLKDEKIPECDFLYLGGGYPELHLEELSGNMSMKNSIKDFADSGKHIYAEGGGFMYLMEYVEGHEMCAVFKGSSTMTDRLQRFGYLNIELNENCLLGRVGDILTGNEFHKSITTIEGEEVFKISKPMSKRKWVCGYKYKNVLAGYPHINFLGSMKAFNCLLDRARKER